MTDVRKLFDLGKLSCDIRNLPSPPLVIQKLHSLIGEEDVDIGTLSYIVETDPAFSARLLRLVNSSFYGFQRRISSVNEAVTILGFNSIHQLLLATSVMNILRGRDAAKYIENFWQHSFAVGIIARNLLQNADQDTRSGAFACGILHDIGRLVLVNSDDERFLWFYYERQGVSSIDEEKDYFGLDHQEAGLLLAQKWNFPGQIADVIGKHHHPDLNLENKELIAAINIADILTIAMGVGDSGNRFAYGFSSDVWSCLNLDYDELKNILIKSIAEIKQSRDFLVNLR